VSDPEANVCPLDGRRHRSRLDRAEAGAALAGSVELNSTTGTCYCRCAHRPAPGTPTSSRCTRWQLVSSLRLDAAASAQVASTATGIAVLTGTYTRMTAN
jgi:hypothetical protein